MKAAALTLEGKPVNPLSFGVSKFVRGGVALNFGTSGGAHCSKACVHHPAKGGACYAVRTEKYRTNLGRKLQRIEDTPPADVVRLASSALDLHGWRLPWFRLSAFGAVPSAVPAGLPALLRKLSKHGTPIHFPTECKRKRERYAAALDGSGVVVRWSATGQRAFLNTRRDGVPSSVVVGEVGSTRAARTAAAARFASAARRDGSGRGCIVCPASLAGGVKGEHPAAKCGRCTACAEGGKDVVYVLH